jgi:predicted transcriptional regulator
MKKDSIICFRASRDLHESLMKIAQEEKRSLSSIIEIALTGYVKDRKLINGAKDDRRQYQRKNILAPALIMQHGPGETTLDTGIGSITDISLGGVRITIPKDAKYEISADPQTSKFEIIFTLPNENKPIYLTCKPRRVVDTEESIHVGASFTAPIFTAIKPFKHT